MSAERTAPGLNCGDPTSFLPTPTATAVPPRAMKTASTDMTLEKVKAFRMDA
jgi:hypothetical protein